MTTLSFQRVLVTGGAGFIGSNFIRSASARHPEWQIIVLDKLTYAGNLANLADVRERITFVRGDIAEPGDVRPALRGVDAVLNFAAESHVDRSLLDAAPFFRTNVTGTDVLLTEARTAGVRRFVQISTDEVYGDCSGTTRHSVETDALRPSSPYAVSKAQADERVLASGLNFVITRSSNTYGPFQYPEKIIPLFVTNALEDRPLPVYGDGSAVRDYLHVEDHAAGVDHVLHAGRTGEVYNLGARLEVAGRTVAETILKRLGKPASLVRYVTDRSNHDYRYAVDPGKAEALGWTKRWSFADGLEATIAWYTKNPGWWQEIKGSAAYRLLMQDWYGQRVS